MTGGNGTSALAGITHRVVLVGRTGLDAALRLHSGVELLRAHSALEAIGELASMPADVAGERTFLLVAPEVAHGLESGGALADRFVRAVHASTPGARVLVLGPSSVGGPAGPPRDRGAFDGVITAENPLGFLRDTGAGAAPQAAPVRPIVQPTAPVQAPAAPPIPAAPPVPILQPVQPLPPMVTAPVMQVQNPPAIPRPQPAVIAPAPPAPHPPRPATTPQQPGSPAAPASAAPATDAGDTSIVALLIRRADIIPAAVALIRSRLNDRTVEFSPGAAQSPPTAASQSCPVTWDANTFGTLRSTQSRSQALAPHARWLAGWLRLRDQQDQMHEAAFTDALTGAWNRRYFEMFLGRALSDARAQRRYVSVLLFDVDDLKKYNDTHGHAAGDEVLTQTVSLLRSTIRPTDRVCRVGGDEFAVIFHDPEGPRQEGSQHPASVFDIAQRFQRQVGEHRFASLGGAAAGTLSVSGGLATFPWDGQTPVELLKRADDLLLESKRQGKRAIRFGPEGRRLDQ